MAEQKIDPRDVRKIKTAIAQSGQKKADRRFGNSPEMQQVQQQLQKGQARAVDRHRAARHDSTPETSKKENMMVDNTKNQQKEVPATAQQRVTQRQQAQARQNARLKDRSKNQSQGMGM